MKELPDADILLLEDEPEITTLIVRAFLRDLPSLDVRCARSMAEARAEIARQCPDLMIADLSLPDGNGAEWIGRACDTTQFPVMILTAHGNEQAAVDAMKSGAMDYVVKSADTIAALPGLARSALRQWGHLQARRRAEAALVALNAQLEQRVRDRTAELERALREVQLLSGLLPICSMCRRIRGAEGHWLPIETYLTAHSPVRFSHSYCPDCSRECLEQLARVPTPREEP